MTAKINLIAAIITLIAALFTYAAAQREYEGTFASSLESVERQPVPSITVKNELRLPVEVYIKGEPSSIIVEPGETKSILSNNLPAKVSWEVVKVTNSDGSPLGDDMDGSWRKVYPGAVLHINNIVGDQQYFFAVMNNMTPYDCEITINEGSASENHPDTYIPAQSRNLGLGYYQFFPTDSNIVVSCRDGSRRFESFANFVGEGDGYACFIIQ